MAIIPKNHQQATTITRKRAHSSYSTLLCMTNNIVTTMATVLKMAATMWYFAPAPVPARGQQVRAPGADHLEMNPGSLTG